MTHHRETVMAAGAARLGPYSHAVRAAGLIFLSGQVPVDPSTDDLLEGPIGDQAAQCLRNLAAVAEAAGASLEDAVRMGVYLIDMGDFAEVNEAYAAFFGDDPPARTAIAVAGLPRGARIEIDGILAVPD